jgi:two-component system, NtrC family, sensor histidine kinase PilS
MDLRTRLTALIVVRVVVSTLLLGSAIVVQVNSPGAFPVNPFFFLIGLTYALSVGYVATVRFAERFGWLADIQLAADALIISAFIYVTGGITSYFSSLYLLPIIAASTFRFRRGALQLATLTAVLYLGLVSAQYLHAVGYLPHIWHAEDRVLPGTRFAQYTVAINLFGFFAVALLSGSLAEGLRSAGKSLERASNQIADIRAFNEHIIDSLLSGLATTAEDGRVLTFNRAGSVITGLPVTAVVGRDVFDVLQIDASFRQRLLRLEPAQSLRIDAEHCTADRRTIDIGITASTLAFPDGRRGFLFTFQDVTDMRRLERNARLQQRLAAVGEMAAGIAHEIRNPLAAMSGSIQVLRHELPLSEEQAQLMDIVLRESDRLNDTIRSFLAYARPQRFNVKRLDLRKTLQDTALLLRNGSDVRDDQQVDVEVPAEPVWYEADENQLRQIIWNLATNGLRAMASGGTLRLAVATEPSSTVGADFNVGPTSKVGPNFSSGAPHVVLTVSDSGRGIPAEELEAIFQPFRSSFEKGTGLGLAIVHRIVTDYGGSIDVSSAVGAGTTMRVRMPVRPPTVVPTHAAAAGGAATI